MRLGKTFLCVLIICFCFNYNFAQLTEDRERNPYKTKFVYKDLRNFIKAYKMLTRESDTVVIIQSEYLDKGTLGLKEFIAKYNLTAKRISRAMYRYPESYSNIKNKLKALKAGEKKFSKDSYNKLKQLIPSSEFPPTYYLIGARRGIGSGSVYGPLISIEKDNIDNYYKGDVSTLVHEMVHMQQLRVLYSNYISYFF